MKTILFVLLCSLNSFAQTASDCKVAIVDVNKKYSGTTEILVQKMKGGTIQLLYRIKDHKVGDRETADVNSAFRSCFLAGASPQVDFAGLGSNKISSYCSYYNLKTMMANCGPAHGREAINPTKVSLK